MLETDLKGQVGESLTWIVATIVIVIVLIVGIYLTGAGGIVKGVLNKDVHYIRTVDRFADKSLNGVLLSSHQESGIIYNKLRQEGTLVEQDKESAMLSTRVFRDLYNLQYREIWFGVSTLDEGLLDSTYNGRSNEYFGSKPRDYVLGPGGTYGEAFSLSHTRWLKDNEYSQLFFVGELK